jgi:hypothetical protein
MGGGGLAGWMQLLEAAIVAFTYRIRILLPSFEGFFFSALLLALH